MGMSTNGYRVSFWAEENLLEQRRQLHHPVNVFVPRSCLLYSGQFYVLRICAELEKKKEKTKPDITGEGTVR